MVLSRFFAIIFSIMLFSCFANKSFALAISEPVEWVTKQDINLMRYVSNDGKVTLFQKPSGSLVYTNNYSVKDILQGNEDGLILVYSLPDQPIVILWKREEFLGNYNPIKNGKIFLLNIKTEKIEEIGAGVSPQFHLNGQWISWYLPQMRVIQFVFLDDRDIKFQIKLNPKVDPYFNPQSIMLNQNQLIYTDSNLQDQVALIFMDRMTQKPEIIRTASHPGHKMDLCQNSSGIFLGDFSLLNSNPESKIFKLDETNPKDFAKFKTMYESASNDLGQLTCYSKGSLFFIKSTQAPNQQWPSNDIVQIIPETKESVSRTNWGDITQIIAMGNLLLTQRTTSTYLLEGESNSKADQLIEKQVTP